jgi:hypothetical protein
MCLRVYKIQMHICIMNATVIILYVNLTVVVCVYSAVLYFHVGCCFIQEL